MLNGKKLLILGGAFQHCKVVEAAKELGIKTYVTDYLANSPAKDMADVSLMYDVKDIDSIVAYCKQENIDGVINTSLDPCQIPYQEICTRLSLSCYGNEQQFFQLTNKQAFKSLCHAYGVDTITSYSIDDLKNTIEKDHLIEFPIMIKPEDSRGSRGQAICYNTKEALHAAEKAAKESSTGNIIIEKYISGAQDFAAAYIIVNGKAYLVRTCDRYIGSAEEGLNRVAIAAENPSKYTKKYLEYVNDRVIAMLEGMGIKNGPVFMQGIIDGETVRFYDPGFRFSGGEYERLFKLATGIDLMKMLIRFAITGDMGENLLKPDSVLLAGKRILHLDPTLRPGKISKVIGLENVKNHEKVISLFKRYDIGEIVPESENVSRRYAEICLLTDNKEEEIRTIQYIQNTLHVLDENGDEMLCNPFDFGNL